MQYTPAELPKVAELPVPGALLTRRNTLIVLAAVFLLVFGYFGATAFKGALQFYVTVDEFVSKQGQFAGQRVQVKGKLVRDSFERPTQRSTTGRFMLEENGERVAAVYDGVLPDLFFNPYSEIVLNGTYDAASDTFVADRVLVKCPSKYRSLPADNPSADPAYGSAGADGV